MIDDYFPKEGDNTTGIQKKGVKRPLEEVIDSEIQLVTKKKRESYVGASIKSREDSTPYLGGQYAPEEILKVIFAYINDPVIYAVCKSWHLVYERIEIERYSIVRSSPLKYKDYLIFPWLKDCLKYSYILAFSIDLPPAFKHADLIPEDLKEIVPPKLYASTSFVLHGHATKTEKKNITTWTREFAICYCNIFTRTGVTLVKWLLSHGGTIRSLTLNPYMEKKATRDELLAKILKQLGNKRGTTRTKDITGDDKTTILKHIKEQKNLFPHWKRAREYMPL